MGALDNNNPKFASAMSYRSANQQVFRDWSIPGHAVPDAARINAKYDLDRTPLSLGTGVLVDTNGRYLLNDAGSEPVSKFAVVNNGSSDIYAGVNTVASGTWGALDGLVIGAGQSFEFGEDGTQVIRNVWAVSSVGSIWVQGYATNLDSGIV